MGASKEFGRGRMFGPRGRGDHAGCGHLRALEVLPSIGVPKKKGDLATGPARWARSISGNKEKNFAPSPSSNKAHLRGQRKAHVGPSGTTRGGRRL